MGRASEKAWVNIIQDRLVVRIAASNSWHPLRKRWDTSHISWLRRRTRVGLTEGFQINAPWKIKPYNLSKLQIGEFGKSSSIRSFLDWQKSAPDLDLFIFLYGLMDTNGFSDRGYAIYRGSNLLYTGLVILGSFAEVHGAEIAVAVSGAKAVLETTKASLSENINLCLGNVAVAVI